MPEVNLHNVYAAITLLKEKYSDFVFEPSFELTVSGTRGIFDTRISPVSNPSNARTHMMIVSIHTITTVDTYVRTIEAYLKEQFGIRD